MLALNTFASSKRRRALPASSLKNQGRTRGFSEDRMQEQIRRVDAGAAEYSDFADIMKGNQPVSSRLLCFSFCEGIRAVSSLVHHSPPRSRVLLRYTRCCCSCCCSYSLLGSLALYVRSVPVCNTRAHSRAWRHNSSKQNSST